MRARGRRGWRWERQGEQCVKGLKVWGEVESRVSSISSMSAFFFLVSSSLVAVARGAPREGMRFDPEELGRWM
jgi:hypothetical protein